MHQSPLHNTIDTIVKAALTQHPIDTHEISRDVLAHMDLTRLGAGGGLRTKDMTREERKARREHLTSEARRKRQARKKAERAERDEAHNERSKKIPEPLYKEGLTIAAPLIGTIDKTVYHYGRRYDHIIGEAHLHEVAIRTLDDMARLVVTDPQHSPQVYSQAALHVSTLPGIPSVERSAPPGAARLAAILKRRARFNVIDWYRENPSIESIEMLATLAENMHLQVENLLAKGAELNRNPFSLPDKPNMLMFRMIVDSAINNLAVNGESVGWLLDLLMDADERDNVGRFQWVKHGEKILRAFSLPVLPDSDVMNGVYAMKACLRVFSTLPTIIRSALVICGDPRLLGDLLDGTPHHTRHLLIPTAPVFELSNARKHIIIPDSEPAVRLKDLVNEIDTGLTAPQLTFRKDRDARVKEIVKLAAALPTDELVSELEHTFRMLLGAERELADA